MKFTCFSSLSCRSLALLLLLACAAPARAFLIPPAHTVDADSLVGRDTGERINNVVSRMGKRQGDIAVLGGGDIRTTIRLGIGQSLVFGPGTWRCHASPCIVLSNASQVIGSGIYRTRLELASSAKGPLLQSKDFVRLAALSEKEAMQRDNSLEGDRKQLPGVKYIKIKDLTLDGNKKARESKRNGVEIYGYWFWMEDVSIERFSGDGLVTQFIPGGGVDLTANDAMESYFTRVKLLSNGGNGWTVKGPHDAVASGVMALNNGAWGIDVQHKEGHYSGGGLMLTNTHLYGNGNGMRTEAGANILAFGLESEANYGVGLLLRSNDSVIQGTFYANQEYGIQFGDGVSYAGANVLTVQVHNNRKAQIKWESSGGYNMVTGTIFPNDKTQQYFESSPTQFDQVLTAGPYAVQHFPGGLRFDSDRNIYGGKMK